MKKIYMRFFYFIGLSGQREIEILVIKQTDSGEDCIEEIVEKKAYQRSAKAEARLNTKKNASVLLDCWNICPFRWIKNKFKCAYCEMDFIACNLLRDHVRSCAPRHTITDIYKKFKEMSIINVDLTEASCKFCSVALKDFTHMRMHVVEHGFHLNPKHPDGVLPFFLDKDSWACVICHEKFNNFLRLYEHMNVHYQHYICAICGKGFMTAIRLRKHSEVHVSGSFPCDECGRVFSMRAARESHKANTHAKGPRYKCPHCEMRFIYYSDRMNHLHKAHREKEVVYDCPHCPLSFKASGKRAKHIHNKHFPPQRSFQCSSCDWTFRNSYELKRHVVKHTGDKKYLCTVCDKSYPRSRALNIHMKRHQPEDVKKSQDTVNMVDPRESRSNVINTVLKKM
ncbi:hypothetical protein NE865_06893 [Phthorimaea operculella]|nr:hypothetical protein NE865_06893 [Phthorimaea operculella]